MKTKITLYSINNHDIPIFLKHYYNQGFNEINEWEIEYDNPIEMVDLIGVFLDNNDKYNINMWISLDLNIYININNHNGNKIIKYLFERYPY